MVKSNIDAGVNDLVSKSINPLVGSTQKRTDTEEKYAQGKTVTFQI